MLERELKFYVPTNQRDGVARAMHALGSTTLPLHACYFDTMQGDLAKNRIALRLRLEDQQWVQTIKAPGPDKVTHIELNHPRPEASLDLSVYQNSSVAYALAGLNDTLVMRYETIISREVVTINHQGCSIELAYDLGTIRSRQWQTQVYELEFEQLTGDVNGLFDLALQWLYRHSLVLDFRSKAQRGNTLAMGQSLHAVRKAHDIVINDPTNLRQAYLQSANEYLAHSVANANLLAGSEGPVSTDMARRYAQQLSLGIRYLLSCWEQFQPWGPIENRPAPVFLEYFAAYDQDQAITQAINPQLQSALLQVLHGLVSTAERLD